MKNKAEVITSINAAQVLMNETPSAISSAVNRPALEAILLAYVERYRSNMRNMADNEVIETGTVEKLSTRGFETIECPACEGTSIYAPNGGPCFRCAGKGHQTEADQKRNYGYDLHHQPAPTPEPHIKGQVPTRVEDYDPDDIPF